MRLLLAGAYYFDVDMINSLPNVAQQLDKLDMVNASNLEALRELCARRDVVLRDIVEFHGVADDVELGRTARDAAKDLQPLKRARGALAAEYRVRGAAASCRAALGEAVGEGGRGGGKQLSGDTPKRPRAVARSSQGSDRPTSPPHRPTPRITRVGGGVQLKLGPAAKT